MELNPEVGVKIVGLAVHKYMVTNLAMIQRRVDETMHGRAGFDESCYPDFWINLRARVSYIVTIVPLAEMMKRN